MTDIGQQKTGKYAELPLRIASAAVLAAFALLCAWIGGKTFTLLAIALALLIFFEFRAMVRSHLPSRFAFAAFGFLLLVFGFYLVNQQISGLTILGVGTGVLLLWEWIVQRRIWGAVLLVYAAVPFAALVDMREGDSGFFIILFVFACVWGADTFAYFSGKTFGGPKLAPSISPNKTWSGFIGGIAGAIMVSALLEIAFGYPVSMPAVFLAVLLALFSQIGDLFESWVKRRFGVKDSGTIIPGHGGLLDRIDGLIFAIAAAWVISYLVSNQPEGSLILPHFLMQAFFS